MNGQRAYSVRLEGAKYGASFSSVLAIATRSCGRSSTRSELALRHLLFRPVVGKYSAAIRSHWLTGPVDAVEGSHRERGSGYGEDR